MRKSVLLLAVWLAGCDRPAERAAHAAEVPAPTPAPVADVVKVDSQILDTRVHLPGELFAYEAVALYPRVNAFVEQVLVDRGSAVRKGQLLVRLSAPELAAQRAEAEARALSARSTYERTRAAAETPGTVAKHDLEVQEATAKAEQARVEALRTLEGYLSVRAPFDGMVTERDVHPGALVGPPQSPSATPLLRMESVDRLRLTVAVPETDAGAIADGSTAEFVVRTWPGERFKGIIRRISHAVDTRTRTMPVELDVDNHAGRLAPGMFADIDWPVHRRAPTLFVPSSAVVQTPNRTFVDRVHDGILEQVPVERGVAVGDRVEVFGRLGAGDSVLQRGSEEMKSGARVTVRSGSPSRADAK